MKNHDTKGGGLIRKAGRWRRATALLQGRLARRLMLAAVSSTLLGVNCGRAVSREIEVLFAFDSPENALQIPSSILVQIFGPFILRLFQ